MSTIEPDAYQVWHSTQAAKKGSNAISYKNSRVDKILEKYRREFDAQKRIEMYKEFQQILHEEQPYTFLLSERRSAPCIVVFKASKIFPTVFAPSIGGFPPRNQKFATTDSCPITQSS